MIKVEDGKITLSGSDDEILDDYMSLISKTIEKNKLFELFALAMTFVHKSYDHVPLEPDEDIDFEGKLHD